jgi:thioredoxin reductase
MKDVVRKHHLEPYIRLSTQVVQAEWLEPVQAYKVVIQDHKGLRSTLMANVIISATGVLHIPRMPDIPGIGTFKGKVFHTSQWDASADLVGKRVAVIGNGSTGYVGRSVPSALTLMETRSSAQIMSEIPKIEGIQVTQFFRTPNWILPGVRRGSLRCVEE